MQNNIVRLSMIGVLITLLVLTGTPLPHAAARAGSVYTVVNTNDSGAGSLRQAILDANAHPGTDTINFNIPGPGPHTIMPTSALPVVGRRVLSGLWTGKYYYDANLNRAFDAGEYRFSAPDIENLDFEWGFGGPTPPPGSTEPALPSKENFLARWTTTIHVTQDTLYTIHTQSNDGIRLIFDPPGDPDTTPDYATSWDWAINAWIDSSTYRGIEREATVSLTTGFHVVLVEYYQNTDNARAHVSFSQPELDSVIIDGLSQPGASCDSWPPTLMIEISGAEAGFHDNLVMETSGSLVRGLVINRFYNEQILVSHGDHNVFECNYISTDVSGTTVLSRTSIQLEDDSQYNRIGTNGDGVADSTERNLISGGIDLGKAPGGINTAYNVIAGNYIGTDASGMAALSDECNSAGIYLGRNAHHNLIGSNGDGLADDAERNVISGNYYGVFIDGASNTIAGNYIGTDVTGTGEVGNCSSGIRLGSRDGNVISNNIIAYSKTPEYPPGHQGYPGGDGIAIFSPAGDLHDCSLFPFSDIDATYILQGNSIFSNERLGINHDSYFAQCGDDGITPNDPGDIDNLQNYPVLTGVTRTAVQGTISSTPNTTLTLEFFSSTTCDPSGYGEGEIFRPTTGPATVTTDAEGNASFTFQLRSLVPNGHFVTATVTNPARNTSEFSACIQVQSSDPTVLTVTQTGDSGAGSLRQAILDANAHSGKDFISFNIPGAGPHTIALDSALPTITDPVVIDGTTQPGANCTSWPPTLKIEVSGEQDADPYNGLVLQTDDSLIRGLVINRMSPGQVLIQGDNNAIECNFIGTNVSGTALFIVPDYVAYGISIENNAQGNRIGTNGDGLTDLSERNLIGETLSLTDGANNNVIAGNYIGPDVTGMAALAREYGGGVELGSGAHHNLIGTNGDGVADWAERNIISGNASSGIYIGSSSFDNVIAGNFIGTDATGQGSLGNDDFGVLVTDAGDNLIGGTQPGSGNVIAFNPQGGVMYSDIGPDDEDCQHVLPIGPAGALNIRGNSIFSNGHLGINLHTIPLHCGGDDVTPNDPGDADTGRNGLQNFPMLTNALPTAVQGTLNSTPNTTFTLEFFSNVVCDPSGYGEGATFQPTSVSPATVTTDADGNVSFFFNLSGSVNIDRFITATATDPAGHTSEFSACQIVSNALPLLTPADGSVTSNNQPTFAWSSVPDATSYQFQVATNSHFDTPEQDVTVNETSYTAAVLADGMTYYWRVRSLNASQQTGSWSKVWSLHIDISRPAMPALRAPTDRSNTADTTPILRWKKVKGATQYRLEIDTDPAFGSASTRISTRTSYTIPNANALPYGEYFWRVQAGNEADLWSEWSMIRRFTVTLLKSPANARHLTDTTPTLKWSKPSGAQAFEFKLDNSSGVVVAPVNLGLRTRYTSAELPDGEYWWSVRVQVGNVWSEWMPTWTFTITAPPTVKPALLTPKNGSIWPDVTPIFTWNSVSGGHHYQIQIDNKRNFRSPLQDAVLDEGVLTYTASELADGGKYYWRVRAINEVGVAGAWGGPFHFTLTQLSAPALTSPRNKATMNDRTPDFSWNIVTNATSYQFQISTDPNFLTITHQGSAASNAYTVPDLNTLPDGVYSWRVRAINEANIPGKWSGKRSFTIDNTGPAAPVLNSPKLNSGTIDSTPTFKWKAPKDGKTYRIQVTTEDDPTFAAMLINETAAKTSFTPLTTLSFGGYLWRVQSFDALGNPGDFGPASSFDITLHKLPADGASSTNSQPAFIWNTLPDANSYEFELATDADFNHVIATYSGAKKSYKPAALGQGTYYWHVKANTSGWMPAWTVIITPKLPTRPVLTAPVNKARLNDSTPTLSWNAVTGITKYQVQIDNNTNFSSPVQDVMISNLLNYIASELPDGTYVWRVRAINVVEAAGAWSSSFKLTIDTIPPAVPIIIAPVDGTSMTNTKFSLKWNKVTDAVRYEVQIDLTNAFLLPSSDIGNKTSYKPETPLARGIYWWRVRAIDKAGNTSRWTTPRTFEIVAGVTNVDPPPTPTPEIIPTDVLVEPTLEPTAMLAPAVIPPDVPLYTLESDDSTVTQTGSWTAHDTPYASGGRYLYSSGSLDDALIFTFSGTQLDAIYIQHPALGQFVVEVDGAPLLLVDGYAAEAAFGVWQTISLSAGQHTVRVYPLTGTIAIDAFIIQQASIIPLDEPTVEPTLEPTVEPTLIPTLAPTETPVVVLLPFNDNFDSGQGWTANGAWFFDIQAAHNGAGWWADSTQRGFISTLTFNGRIDLTTAPNPQLGFWQRGVLSATDVLSIEVSTDGGLMWWPVFRQSSLSTDWLWQTVDLSAYRGSIIALRFVLNTTEVLPEGVVTVGFGLDDLLIQDAPIPRTEAPPLKPTLLPTQIPTVEPTIVSTEIPTEVPTLEPTVVPTETPPERELGA